MTIRAILAASVILALASPTSHAQTAACTDEAEAEARGRFDRAEAFKSEDRLLDAAREYQAAFDICPRPFLLFNAGQMLWLGGEKRDALEYYERYLELEPDGQAAPVAREQIFAAAEELRSDEELDQALRVYERYLELAPEGDDASTARLRVDEIRAVMAEREAEEQRRLAEAQERLAGAQRLAEARERADSRRSVWKPLAVAGAGAAIVLGGGLLHRQAVVHGEEFDRWISDLCGSSGCLESELPADVGDGLERARLEQRLAIASYAVGGAALAGGLVWMIVKRRRASSESEGADSSVGFTPVVSPGSIGGGWQVRF